jgi:hypothetical protein
MNDDTLPPSSRPLINRFWSLTDKRDSRTMTAERFSIAFTISFSLFADVEHTPFHAVAIFGADSTGFTVFAVVAIWVFPFLFG